VSQAQKNVKYVLHSLLYHKKYIYHK